jgi:hypothetical protein
MPDLIRHPCIQRLWIAGQARNDAVPRGAAAQLTLFAQEEMADGGAGALTGRGIAGV